MKNALKYFIVLIDIIFCSNSAIGQKIINLKADMILVEGSSISFIRNIKDNKVQLIRYGYYNPNEDDEQKSIVIIKDDEEKDILIEKDITTYINLNTLLEKRGITQSDLIPVDSLKNSKLNKLIDELASLKFTMQLKGYNNIEESLHLVMSSRYFFSQARYSSYYDSDIDLYGYYIIYINNKYSVVVLIDHNSDEGIIIPYKSIYKVVLESSIYNSHSPFSMSVDLRNKIFREQSYRNYIFQLFKSKNKYGIQSILGNVILHPIYDTICMTDNNFIFAKKGKSYKLFNSFFEKLNTDHVRAAYSERYLPSAQILQGNKLYWVDKSGKKSDTLIRDPIVVCGIQSSWEKNYLIKEIKKY